MASRYVLSVAVGAALAVAVTGCRVGGDAGPKKAGPARGVRSSALDALARTSQKTSRISSFRVTATITGTFSGQRAKMSAHADIGLRPRPAERWTISNMTVAGQSMAGIKELILGDSIYLKVPADTRQAPRKPWIRFSLRQLAAGSGLDFTSSLNNQADPSATVAMLTASKDVRTLGQETVGGVRTTHYRGTYFVRDALAKLDAKQRASASRLYQQAGMDKMAFDLWVDGNQLPREVKLRTPAGAKTSIAMKMLFSGFNEPVSISAPPRSQVTDGTKLGLPGKMPA